MSARPGLGKEDAPAVIGRTQSVCPVCLGRLPAERVREGDSVFLRKACPEHGEFRTIIWRGPPDYLSWQQQKVPEHPRAPLAPVVEGCPFDCGLCPDHWQEICCAQIEVTERCNLGCPVCFADAGEGQGARPVDGPGGGGRSEGPAGDPSLEELVHRLEMVRGATGACNIQLSGGEPTVRDDLPDIIRAARSLGHTFFQLNTNGIRLGEDPGYVQALAEAGLGWVFLQFDGTRDEIYRRLRGRSLLVAKERAIAACRRAQLGVVLVPTLVPGVNTGNIGDMVRYALKGMPVIRGVHFQPVSYFGRYPHPPRDEDRFTLPEVMRALEEQTDGLLRAADLAPSDCESSVCSFHGDFIYMGDGRLTPSGKGQNGCGCGPGRGRAEAVSRSRNFVRSRWRLHGGAGCCGPESRPPGQGSWDAVLDRVRNHRLSITCMAFQDAWNMDLERLRSCCVAVVDGGRTIPFCAYNLTGRDGRSLYRGTASTSGAGAPAKAASDARKKG